jgi:hypothetical protein
VIGAGRAPHACLDTLPMQPVDESTRG